MMWRPLSRLSNQEKTILVQMIVGWSLKSHRDIEGNKQFILHSLAGEKRDVDGETVHKLRRKRFIETNHKFPAATFLLTEKGRKAAGKLTESPSTPVGARKFVQE